jgi:hypothetical protein
MSELISIPPELQNIDIYVETTEKSYALFRYNRPVSEADIRTLLNRNGLGKFLCKGLADEALGKGWNIVEKKKGKVLPENEEFQNKLRPLLKDLVKGVGLERGYGHCMFGILDEPNNHKMHLRVYEPQDYYIRSDRYGNINEVYGRSKIKGYVTESIPHDYVTESWVTDKDLENVYHSIVRPGAEINQGESYLMDVWDDVNAVELLNEHTAIFIIRIGAGRIVITGPASMLNDQTTRDSIFDAAVNMNSANQVLMIPQPDGTSDKVETKLETVTAAFNVLEMRKLYIQNISATKGIPALRLDGASQNYATAGEEGTGYLWILEDIQEENYELCMWLTTRILEVMGKPSDNFKIEFNVKRELSEAEQMEVLKQKVDILSQMMFNQQKLSIDLPDAMDLVDLEYKITEIAEPDMDQMDLFDQKEQQFGKKKLNPDEDKEDE